MNPSTNYLSTRRRPTRAAFGSTPGNALGTLFVFGFAGLVVYWATFKR